MVFPVILGLRKRLFGDLSDKQALRLAASKTVSDGVAILIYRPAGSATAHAFRRGGPRS